MSISIESLTEAIQIKKQIAELETRLGKLLGGILPASVVSAIAPAAKKGGRRKMSPAARARIAAAQRARWAKAKGTTVSEATASKPARKKRRLSAEGRARIVAALKKRWAAAKK
jgi:hypothetical protein